ncbi:MAG: hypothetical protein IJJ26_10680 [Victivallales bacterium]|nr:hypothetical protein [Victivallales bacterium]
MKRWMWLCLLVCLGCFGAESVFLDKQGRLVMEEATFALDYRDDMLKNNIRQGREKVWQLEKLEADAKAGRWVARGKFVYDVFDAAYTTRLTRTGAGEYEFVAELAYDAAKEKAYRNFTLRTYLPVAAFAGRTAQFDQDTLTFPEKPKPDQGVGKHNSHTMILPCLNGLGKMEFEKSRQITFFATKDTTSFGMMMPIPVEGKVLRLAMKVSIQPYPSRALDLRPVFNMGFQDDVAGDGKGGWTDQGPDNDLRVLKPGRKNLRGLEFNIADPAKNNGKSCLVLAGEDAQPSSLAREASLSVKDAPKGKYLFLLHTATFAGTKSTGTITVTYGDNTRREIPVSYGRDVSNWWNPHPMDNASLVWTSENRSSFIGLFRSAFPLDDKPIASLAFQNGGAPMWMIVAANVGDVLPPVDRSQITYITQSAEWKPIDLRKDILPGSAFDFSWVLDAPAGKYGPTVIRGNHFEFRDRPGVPVKFYGANLPSESPFGTKEQAEKVTERMAHLGFNIIRLHHHDASLTFREDTTKLNEDKAARLDYTLYCMKQRGIYVTIDLFVSRRPRKGEIPEYPDNMDQHAAYKALFWVLDSVWENWKRHVTNVYSHVNPYTGLALKDDPMLVCVNLVNEGNIDSHWKADAFTRQVYMDAFDAWLKQKGVQQVTSEVRERMFDRFLRETYTKRYRQMVDFVRGFGFKCPLSDQNMASSPRMAQYRDLYEYVDNHTYFGNPRFLNPGPPKDVPTQTSQKSALSQNIPVPNLFPTRMFGKPFTVTEWNYCIPNQYRAEGAPLIGSYAAMQDWDMLVQFTYSHSLNGIFRDDFQRNHFDAATDPALLSTAPIGVMLYRTIQPAKHAFSVLLADQADISYKTTTPNNVLRLGLVSRLGTLNVPKDNTLPAVASNVDMFVDANIAFPEAAVKGKPVLHAGLVDAELVDQAIAAGVLPKSVHPAPNVFASEDGALRFNRDTQCFQAVSPSCECLILTKGQAASGNVLAVSNKLGRGVFAAIGVGGKPLATASRILLLHVTDTQRSMSKFNDPSLELFLKWGNLPVLARRGEADITLTLPQKKWKLHAIDCAGKRLSEIPFQFSSGKLSFHAKVFQSFGSVFAYELTAE